jgi:hypothetical protein
MPYRFEPERRADERPDALLDEAELERLADFYHRRGFYQEAIETLDELINVQHDRECERVRHIRRAS